MRLIPLLLFVTFSLASCKDPQTFSLETAVLKDYPSGSGIGYINKRIYLIGDDAPYLLIMDTAFNTIDTIGFFNSTEKRIPKNIKADPEALSVVSLNKQPMLLILGSGSLSPQRNNCWIVNPVTKEKTEIRLDTFYDRLKAAGIKELNIEGVAEIPGGIVLSNRGNRSYPKNCLVFTSHKFWQDQTNAPISIANIVAGTDTTVFNGISGLEYSKLTDRLLLTVSTEDTYDAQSDGAVGKSYIWIINDISSKRTYAGINPARIIDLESSSPKFHGQKIESVCIVSENKKDAQLIFTADDDKGGSMLFKGVLSYN